MPLRIVRNDITKMKTRAIVNTADENASAGPGTDAAVYKAAGYDKLMALRKEIGFVPQGEAFITPGLDLDAEYIIHAVSPVYIDGKHGEEDKLRSCFRKSLAIVLENHIESVSFPLIASGSNCFPKEEAMRIALDEINDFLLHNKDIEICLVLFDPESAETGRKLFPDLESYIDDNYISPAPVRNNRFRLRGSVDREMAAAACAALDYSEEPCCGAAVNMPALDERMTHMSDTFSEYLLYLIESKGMTNVEVYKRAIVDKKVFSKIKNNPDYHTEKMTAMCLCIGAKLNLDETRDLLARAGYALSPCDKTDIIFQYFIEKGIYDMIELDIVLEEHGLKCLIS